MRQLLLATAFAAAAAVAAAAAAPTATAAPFALAYVGQQVLGDAQPFEGTTVGGLSGIEYLGGGAYAAISDDRSQTNPARYYTLDLRFGAGGFTGVSITGVTTLLDPSGNPYPEFASDTEALRQLPNGNLLYTSEGDRNRDIDALVREAQPDGSFVRDLAVPENFQQTGPAGTTGLRNNLALESLALSPDGSTAYIATESALLQDGPVSTLADGAIARIAAIDVATGVAGAQFAYEVDPIPTAPIPPDSFADNGLVELIALGGTEFLALERNFSVGVGNNIRIYLVDTAGATDVSGVESLVGAAYTAVAKELLLDLTSLDIPLDNVEGFTLGEMLPGGNRSLILVSDNNFSDAQITQFLAFEIVETPEPAAAALFGLALAGLVAARRRR